MAFAKRSFDVIEDYIDDKPFVILDWQIPGPSWWKRFPFESRGVEFRDDPQALSGWAGFLPFLEHVRFLSISGRVPLDLTFLSRMTSLELLSSPGSTVNVDVSRTRLRWFEGSGKRLKGVFSLGTLESVGLTRRFPPQEITSPIRDLALRSFSGDLRFDSIAHPELIETLSVDRGRSVDLRSVSALSKLRSLTLWECRRITGVDAIVNLKNLHQLKFLDCPEIEPHEALLEMNGARVFIGGINPFGPGFRRQAERASKGEWTFPDVFPARSGSDVVLIHPGVKGAIKVRFGSMDVGPGGRMSSWWERATDPVQLQSMKDFASRIGAWIESERVTEGLNKLTGKRFRVSSALLADLVDTSDAVELELFVRGEPAIWITESIWQGVMVDRQLIELPSDS